MITVIWFGTLDNITIVLTFIFSISKQSSFISQSQRKREIGREREKEIGRERKRERKREREKGRDREGERESCEFGAS